MPANETNERITADQAVTKMTERRSVRAYRNEHIPEEILDRILSAGITAATGGNLQPYSILVEKDPERKEWLSEILHYPFVKNADICLIFLLDWHKLEVYSHCRKAPFVEHASTSHFMIAWDDTLAAVQATETAAWLYGVGSCYIGHIMDCVEELTEKYHLPEHTFPAILLTLGYPKTMPPKTPKLAKKMVVFEGDYPQLTEEEICAAYDAKYVGRKLTIPKNTETANAMIEKFRRALHYSYNDEQTEQIVREVQDRGYVNEIQRLFGLHYHPERELGNQLSTKLAKKGLTPFGE